MLCNYNNFYLLIIIINQGIVIIEPVYFLLCCKGNSRKTSAESPSEQTRTGSRCHGKCEPIAKPIVDSSATVYVILGLKAIDRSKIIRESVLTKKVPLSI